MLTTLEIQLMPAQEMLGENIYLDQLVVHTKKTFICAKRSEYQNVEPVCILYKIYKVLTCTVIVPEFSP